MFGFGKKKETKVENTSVVSKPDSAMVGEEARKSSSLRKKEFGKMEYEVLIGKNTAINGNININGCTRIDGVIDGTLAVDSDLFIGETGVIRATVYAQNASIAGTVTANIVCRGRLELTPTARITGDIKCGTLVIAEGAEFNGKCEKLAEIVAE